MGILEELNITEEEYIDENPIEEALYKSGLIDEEGNIILPEE